MISEGSCETEAWSNEAENSALHHMNKLHFKNIYKIKKTVILNCCNISHYYCFVFIDQINGPLVCIKCVLKNIKKILMIPIFWPVV